MQPQDLFPPTRADALNRLADFVPHAGQAYAKGRNHDPGPGDGRAVSTLSPYLRARVLTEEEVLRAVRAHHGAEAASAFIHEVFWRTYFKGWLELRPGIWSDYRAGLSRALDDVQTQSGLRHRWEAACQGETGLDCFDAWARELVQTGYLHNHARMWFASIWIFTLRLPWQLGADFFLRHLLDGDPASNTLSWRWVGGLHTRGKTYLATADNIAEYTGGRFCPAPGDLASEAPPLDGPPLPEPRTLPAPGMYDPGRRTAFVLHEDDLSPGWWLDGAAEPLGTALLSCSSTLSPLRLSDDVLQFRKALMRDSAAHWRPRLGPITEGLSDAAALSRWARDIGAEQIVTSYAPTGPVAELLAKVEGPQVIQMLRGYDARAWPLATAGFFKFRKRIPELLAALPPAQNAA